jgi:Fe-S cluster assembly protein SufD
MTAVLERFEGLASRFEALRREPVFGAGAAGRAREAAFQRFLAAGFPTTRDEEWRHTSVAPIAALPFLRASAHAPRAGAVSPFFFGSERVRIVLVNGRVSRQLSALDALPAGVTVHTLAEPPAALAGSALEPWARPARPFVDLNEAFFEDVVDIRIAPRTVLDAPVHVVAVTAGDQPGALVLPRVLVHVGEGAEASVIESYVSLGDAPVLTSAVTEITLEPAAVVDHVKLQREAGTAFHMASLAVHLARASTFASRAITLGGRIARNDITAVLGGEGAECTLNGLYVATGESLVDTHTTIDHARPHCPSHEVYKGILAGRARAVFNGKIIVRPDAQKTDAKQTNRALLLSDDAQINTKPQLEIFADDVKCTHGAAIGQLDEDALFYLRSRGLDGLAARHLLIHAFAGDVLGEIKHQPVSEAVMRLVDAKLSID